MLGAIIGDIVGSRFEFNPTNDYNFDLFGPGCSYTDDTICTIAIAEAALDIRKYHPWKDNIGRFNAANLPANTDLFARYLHRWGNKYPNPKGGYGASFAAWLRNPELAPPPYNSFGNGSAMRVSAIPYVFDGSYLESELLAASSASATHNHELGTNGAISVCTAMCSAINGGKKNTVVFSGLFSGNYAKADLRRAKNKFDETCLGTVPVALAIIERSNSFEDAIRRAVSLGADADTLAAIVGSIAEPLWGIPEDIKQQALTFLPEDMLEVYNRFLQVIKK